MNKIIVKRRTNLRKGKETTNFLAHAITVVRWSTRLQTAGNMKPIMARGPRIGRRN